jgi:hypothetical protein
MVPAHIIGKLSKSVGGTIKRHFDAVTFGKAKLKG